MSDIKSLNEALLVTLGLSRESANIIINRIVELETRIAALEKSGEDLETIAWSVAQEIEQPLSDDEFMTLSRDLEKACDEFHAVLVDQPK